MAGKAAAAGAGVLLVTANVGSLFDDPENLQKNWLREFYQVVHAHKPHFMALHCQEFGGKNYEASMSHVDKFVKELLSSDAMKDYNRARVYLDENYKSQEHFTALGSFYFLHESLKNIYQFDFKAKKYKKVTGKEIYSDTLESTPMLEKEKFPQDYFPECKWSRKGFIRTRWCITDCAFDLVNIHLFHDASNLIAWETSPSVYSGIRHKALGYVLDRIIDQRFEKVSYFVFGDFNFRLDAKAVVETLCAKATMQTIRAADTNEVVKLIFRESDNDRKVMLQLEKKLFDYFNQDVFRDNNGTAVLKEKCCGKHRLKSFSLLLPGAASSSPHCQQCPQAEPCWVKGVPCLACPSTHLLAPGSSPHKEGTNLNPCWKRNISVFGVWKFPMTLRGAWLSVREARRMTGAPHTPPGAHPAFVCLCGPACSPKDSCQPSLPHGPRLGESSTHSGSFAQLLEFDRELSVFKDRLYELDISFPPSYPYSEDSSQGRQYMNTRCPAWCDRILMSHSAKELILKSENDEKIVIYDHIGPNVCMGDHKPVFLSFRIAAGAGKPIANVHKCCVVQ
ncbi:inositol polyphosphate-5-phosphatase A isoform X4 [Corvus hawaiiensis]|uniref:inositol polyphosphate-5-phosphatase A isoform X4 n=1 Tax=Corvus hawaiiensis TaxID=134902 RepID=UPI002018BBA3|nr:inositol polyphosphate-5-phosphatase A isoform X4 [Corvus hawaiiensis]XP_048166927.1 inositol polyphosphate-5-phosphatase A isoform X4 [Corvus hawaiiensis]